uniref:SAM domain family protein n=1 Tax=Solanum tuberosum TaxID=4113 RepID=M1A7W0_SOLTU
MKILEILATTSNPTSIAPPPPPSDNPPTNNVNNNNLGPSLAPKRQRRPSVRLGEIGDSPSDTHFRRGPKTWRFHKDPTLAAKTSKTRPLTNLVNGGGDNYDENNIEENNYNLDLGNRKSKSRKPTKRVRTNWHSSSAKFETPNGGGIHEENFFREDNNDNEEFREFELEGSESPVKEHSPINSMEHMGLQYWDRRGIRTRVSESRDQHDDLNNGGVHNEMNSGDKSIGVRDWLVDLGLGRYAPVFEIHEVDDEVLPMLTLEDLKDMGINAVGSRRKMFNAILKLRKGFS